MNVQNGVTLVIIVGASSCFMLAMQSVRGVFKKNNTENFLLFLFSKASLQCGSVMVMITLEVCCSRGCGRDSAAWPGRMWYVLNVLKDIE